MKKDWTYKKLGEVCRIERGGSPRPIKDFITNDAKGLNWIKIGDTDPQGKYIYSTKEKIKPEGLKKSRWVEEDEFLLSNSMSFGRPYILKTNGCIHDGWLVLRDYQKSLNVDFFYYALISPHVQNQFRTKAQGSTVSNLNTDRVSDVNIAFPSLSEQSRIVSRLDSAFAQIDALKANAEKQLEEARKLFQAELTETMKPKEGWEEIAFKKLCNFVRGPFGGSLKKSCFKPSGFAVYEQQHAIYNRFVFRYYIDEDKYNSMKRFSVKPGDLIMSCSGTIGKVAIIPQEAKEGIINQALLKLTPNKNLIDANYLKMLMESKYFGDIIDSYSDGAAIKNIASVSILKEIVLAIPLLSEQQEIVSRLDALSANVKRLEELQQKTLKECDALKQAMLREVFE